MVQGRPRPRKTFTELDPVTLPMDESAVGSPLAEAMDAKVSGRDVPRATNVIAVISSGMPSVHPSNPARSPMTAVTTPMSTSATAKQARPSATKVGGHKAKSTFQGRATMCRIQSEAVGGASPSPRTVTASVNWCAHLLCPRLTLSALMGGRSVAMESTSLRRSESLTTITEAVMRDCSLPAAFFSSWVPGEGSARCTKNSSSLSS
mmetsp:Transcript_26123/g.76602  ORF Transcript_26123/g.76602 Transcript_26123/m.76602 type:complete len:206 (+) Transcript_26123:863-1480(+)